MPRSEEKNNFRGSFANSLDAPRSAGEIPLLPSLSTSSAVEG